jgi:2-methylcitrate dehydratase PrpD
VFRRAGLAEFSDGVVARRDIREAMEKIEFSVYSDEEAARERYRLLTSFLEIRFKDGRTLSARVDAARGTPEQPMSESQFKSMFADRAAYAGLTASRAEELFARLMKLEELGDIREVTELLCG